MKPPKKYTRGGYSSKYRIEWIDIAKGIGIVLVIIGHVSKNKILNNYIYSFHMPLFFIISGYLYKEKTKFVKNKIKTILIPYFIFSILSFSYWAIIERFFRKQEISPLIAFSNIFIAKGPSENFVYNVALWFLPCLFITQIVFHFIYKNTKKSYRFIIILIISILGYIYPNIINIRIPFCIDVSMTAIMFYYIGFIFKQIEKNIIIIKNKKVILLLLIGMISIYINSKIDQCTGMIELKFGKSYFLFYLIAIIGSYTVYLISNKIKLKYLTWIGEHSLHFMCIHEPIKRVIIIIYAKILEYDFELVRENIIHSLLITALTITIVSILIITMNKILQKIKNTKEIYLN